MFTPFAFAIALVVGFLKLAGLALVAGVTWPKLGLVLLVGLGLDGLLILGAGALSRRATQAARSRARSNAEYLNRWKR